MLLADALFIDLDGTLADSHGALRACFDTFLARRGLADPAYFDALDGVRLSDIPARLRERFAVAEPLAELRREYEESVTKAYECVEPAAGAAELVRAAAAAGTPLVVVTSAPRSLAEAFLRTAGMEDDFVAVVSGEDAPAKPDPALFCC